MTLVFVAVILSVVALDTWLIRPWEQNRLQGVPVAPDATLEFVVPRTLFFHPGHTWVRLDEDGRLTVGIDDLARTLIGELSGVDLPAIGEHLTAGLPALGIRLGRRVLRLAAPVSGTVVAVNNTLGDDAVRLRWRPYKEGWAYRMAPDDRLSAELGELVIGREAERWMSNELDRLRLLFERGVLTLPVEGVLWRTGDDTWALLQRDFLNIDSGSPEVRA